MLLLAAALAAGSSRSAHVDTVSFATLRVGESSIELELELDTVHLMQCSDALPPKGEDWSEEDVRAVEPQLLEYLAGRWRLSVDGRPQELSSRGFELRRSFDPFAQADRALRVAFAFTLPRPPRAAKATLEEDLFEGIEMAHRHVLRVEADGAPGSEQLVPNATPYDFELPDVGPGATMRRCASAATVAARRLASAPWLPLFLLALLVAPLPSRERARSLLATLASAVLAFALARADVISPAPWAAAAAAALSVAYLAAENRFSRKLELRLPTAALFGLVHGMAIGALPRGSVPPSLLESVAFAAAAFAVSAALAVVVAASLTPLVRRSSAAGTRSPAVGSALDFLLMGAGALGVTCAVLPLLHRG
jgi:hypothetical protein